jgi:protein PET117
MYEGVIRDDRRREEKKQQRLLDLEESRKKRGVYEEVQSVVSANEKGR